MEITGKIHEIGITESVSDKLNKRNLVLEYAENPQYPEYISFECINDKCNLLDNLSEGNQVTVHFNLRGRPWTNKQGVKQYFNSLHLWKVS